MNFRISSRIFNNFEFRIQQAKKNNKKLQQHLYIYQIVHGTKGQMAVYGPGSHPQNIIWTEASISNSICLIKIYAFFSIKYIWCEYHKLFINILMYCPRNTPNPSYYSYFNIKHLS